MLPIFMSIIFVSIVAICSSVLEIPESVALFFAQGDFAGQDFAESPVDTVDSLGDDTNQVLIFGHVCGERNSSQRVSDVMVHFGNHLHSRRGEPILPAADLG